MCIRDRCTPMHYAVLKHPEAWFNHPEAAKLLVAAGADINAKDSDGDTPLDWAKDSRHQSVVSLLKKRDCLLYTSDAADEEDSVDLGGRRIIKKKKKQDLVRSKQLR
eukprot:TRINITY_DN1358_c0_g1_i1.p1 TRINITY_DN1358_c0_g1~~TRINITY_DN1358_c0_g1_i1.p1  ORF type:complete len:107 (-),score=27.81 TRINITY_DN1358_c0_g1_i1:36-356(-)